MRPLAFLLIILAQPLMGKNPWQLIKNEKGIKVYKKADPKSKLLVFKGTGVINKELVYVLAVLADVKSLHKWIETVKRVEILEKRSNTELITYTITKAPWPLKDRDSVALGRVTFDKKKQTGGELRDYRAVLLRHDPMPNLRPSTKPELKQLNQIAL